MATSIKKKQGNNLYLTDSENSKIISFILYGKATQDGNPTPDNPINITVSGSNGSVEIITQDEYGTQTTTSSIPTPDGLAGIKVSSGGNYTDLNGQHWVCDEIVKYADGSGKRVQRIGKFVADGSGSYETNVYSYSTNCALFSQDGVPKADISVSLLNQATNGYCDKFPMIKSIDSPATDVEGVGIFQVGAEEGSTFFIRIFKERLDSLDEQGIKAWLANNPVTVYYELAEPITTELTLEEIAEIEKLHTFHPVTHISNNADCGMAIDYWGRSYEWESPKTDWTPSSKFNIEDYNRIKNNLLYIHEITVARLGYVDIEEMGSDLAVDSDEDKAWDVKVFNSIENNLHAISGKVLKSDIGSKKTFYENGMFPDFSELNRIESATLTNKKTLDNLSAGLIRIPFVLGQYKERF